MSKDFKKYFGNKLPEDLYPKLEQLAKIFSISIEELYINWESFVTTKNNNDDAFNIGNLNRLEQYIHEKLAKKKNATRTPSNLKIRKLKTNASSPLNNASSPSVYESALNTPALKKVKFEESPLPANSATPIKNEFSSPLKSSPFRPSQKSGEVIESLNDTLHVVPDHSQQVKLAANFDKSKYNFRSMRTKLLEAADVLDEQIESFSEIYTEHYKILLSNATIQSQDEIHAVGRIVSDNPAIIDGLNSQSLCLESSRMQGVGKRIPLDLTKIGKFEFFPGQIVCLKGKNPTGFSFQVVEVLPPPLLGSTVFDTEEMNYAYDSEILIFKGPYTLSSEMNFDIFTNATDQIMNQSNAIILLGPFIDINNQLIFKGLLPAELQTAKNIDEIYQKFLITALKKINPSIEIIIIPDLKDSITKYPAYPQPSYPNLKNFKNLKNFANPSIFQINDVSIGVSNIDVFRTCKDVISQSSNSNRFERIINYIIEQRKFYPVFPSSEPLNVPYLGLAEFQSIPDVLILPSDLKPFAKIIKNVLVINPGSFIKPNTGSYVKLLIQKANSDNTDSIEEGIINQIWKRAKVEIVKT